jgi:serine/threonine protein kinase
VDRLIGSGGFGEVWLARRIVDNRVFAVKVLSNPSEADDVARFQKEVRVLSQLNHPNIIRVSEESLAASPYWYSMPHYDRSLSSELNTIRGQDARIYAVFRFILDAIRYAHKEGIIHRDIKPENILMNSDSDLVVSDFGLGRIIDSNSTRLTRSGRSLGTPFYCAPEQLRDFKSADKRSDIFSLGQLLYALYAGELNSVQNLHLVSAPIGSIVERATLHNPDDRYQTVDELLVDFDTTMAVILGIAPAGSLDDVIEQLRTVGSWSEEDVTRLIVALEQVRDEADTVHLALMKVPAQLLSRIVTRSQVFGRALIKKFASHAQSQTWPYSYTDSIANISKTFFSAITDSTIRADLFETVLTVGVAHHRYHVMRVAGNLAEAVRETNDAVAIVRVLRDHASEASSIREYVTRTSLHPALQPYFPGADSSS